jgi:beta-lactamase class A
MLLASVLGGCMAGPGSIAGPSATSAAGSHVPAATASPVVGPTPPATATPIPFRTAHPPTQVPREQVLWTLEEQIRALLRQAPSGTWGVYVEELTRGESVSIRSEEVFHPASTIKVGIAMDLLYWMERHPEVKWTNGPQAGQRSFIQLLEAMLIKSEESATVRLAAFLDGQPGYHLVDRWQSWGVAHTTFIPRRSTPADLARLLELLYNEEVLTPESSDRILAIMRVPKPSQSERIGSGLPAEVRATLANKTGTTFENGAGVVADTGIVEANGKVLVIVVLGNKTSSADYEDSMLLIGKVARAAYETWIEPPPALPEWLHGTIP